MNKYFNPITNKTERLFESLNTVYTVSYFNPKVDGDNDYLRITIESENEDEAKIKAMNNDEFTKHIKGKYFDRKYLKVSIPTGLYVIGKVEYYNEDNE